MIIKSIKLNRHNDRLLGAAVFIGGELIAPFVSAGDTHVNVAIEDVDGGILLKPIKAVVLAGKIQKKKKKMCEGVFSG